VGTGAAITRIKAVDRDLECKVYSGEVGLEGPAVVLGRRSRACVPTRLFTGGLQISREKERYVSLAHGEHVMVCETPGQLVIVIGSVQESCEHTRTIS
jgi:hypothetical protein